MVVMVPIFTFITLNHELTFFHIGVRLLAVAIGIKVIVVVGIFLIVIVFLIEEVAGLGHPSIATITSEISLRIQFKYLMILMTVKHATQTKT